MKKEKKLFKKKSDKNINTKGGIISDGGQLSKVSSGGKIFPKKFPKKSSSLLGKTLGKTSSKIPAYISEIPADISEIPPSFGKEKSIEYTTDIKKYIGNIGFFFLTPCEIISKTTSHIPEYFELIHLILNIISLMFVILLFFYKNLILSFFYIIYLIIYAYILHCTDYDKIKLKKEFKIFIKNIGFAISILTISYLYIGIFSVYELKGFQILIIFTCLVGINIILFCILLGVKHNPWGVLFYSVIPKMPIV